MPPIISRTAYPRRASSRAALVAPSQPGAVEQALAAHRDHGAGQVDGARDVPLPPGGEVAGVDEGEAGVTAGERALDV